MSISNENNPNLEVLDIGTQAAPITLYGMNSGKKVRLITSVKLVNQGALSGDDTNNVKVELKDGSTVLATYTNDVASGGLVDKVAKEMTLSATPSDLKLAKDSDLTIVMSDNGSGQNLTLAKMQVESHAL